MISAKEIVATIVLLSWVIFVVSYVTKRLYEIMRRRGLKHNVAVYYNRKIIHILAGGLCAIIVPFIYDTPILPSVMAMLLSVFTYIPHRTKRLMYWFQTEENTYEVSFCIMWGIIITMGWLISGGDFWFGVVPILFMSIGDAITGVVRNKLYKRRNKSWWGNLAMAIFSIPTGGILGTAGMIAGAIASIIEHFEFGPVDDNVMVPLASFITIVLAKYYAPWLLIMRI